MNGSASGTRYVLCVSNEGYPASLEVRKVYQAVPDPQAGQHAMVRVIDESGEDYLYPRDYFVEISVPAAAAKAFSSTT